jgi:electron transport complex protein RnfG
MSDQTIANIEGMESREPSAMKLILALGIAGMLSGIILVSTFIYTNPMIIANKKAATEAAIFKVLPQCDHYKTLILEGDRLEEKVLLVDGKEEESKEELLAYVGFDENDEVIGFAIPGSEPGFQDIIAAMIGFDASKQAIIGFEVLESKETPGLGDKIFKDAAFQLNFKDLVIEPEILTVKKGEKKNSNEVEAITGATISSKAVVKLLNNTMSQYAPGISAYINEYGVKNMEGDE